jgi:hypothetical protein
MTHSLCRWVVFSLVCGLTVVASGDDVCLLRIVVPSLPASEVPLSLDDPNTDFTVTSDLTQDFSFALHQHQAAHFAQPASLNPPAPVLPHLQPIQGVESPFCLVLLATPLRC